MRIKEISKSVAFLAFFVFLATAFATAQTAPRQEKLLNGLRVLMWSDPKADNVSVKIRVHSGAAFDPQGREGLMQMLSDNLFPNPAAREFFSEDLGGGLEVVTTYDYIQINASGKAESDNLLKILETLAGAVATPQIDKETTAKLKTAQLAKVANLEMDPNYVADQAVAKRLFGTFPYGRPINGTTDSIRKIDFPDLVDADKKFLTADNATLTIAGNYDRNLAFKAVRRYFGSWLKADRKVPSTFSRPDAPPAGLLTVDSSVQGVTILRFAVRGVGRADKEFAVSNVVTNAVEDRLRKLVPVQYSKDVFVRNDAHTLPGSVIIGFSVRSEDSQKEKGDAGDVVSKALAENISDSELAAAGGRFLAEWRKNDLPTVWLDGDTYQFAAVGVDQDMASHVTLSDANAYLAKLRNSPRAVVAILSPPKSK